MSVATETLPVQSDAREESLKASMRHCPSLPTLEVLHLQEQSARLAESINKQVLVVRTHIDNRLAVDHWSMRKAFSLSGQRLSSGEEWDPVLRVVSCIKHQHGRLHCEQSSCSVVNKTELSSLAGSKAAAQAFISSRSLRAKAEMLLDSKQQSRSSSSLETVDISFATCLATPASDLVLMRERP